MNAIILSSTQKQSHSSSTAEVFKEGPGFAVKTAWLCTSYGISVEFCSSVISSATRNTINPLASYISPAPL